MQLGDTVPFRFHWPRAADLRINSMAYRSYGRNPSSKLGNNARDEPASIGGSPGFRIRCSVFCGPMLPECLSLCDGWGKLLLPPVLSCAVGSLSADLNPCATPAKANLSFTCHMISVHHLLPADSACLPVAAGTMCFSGKNRVTLAAYDETRFALGVQLVRKRSQTEVRDAFLEALLFSMSKRDVLLTSACMHCMLHFGTSELAGKHQSSLKHLGTYLASWRASAPARLVADTSSLAQDLFCTSPGCTNSKTHSAPPRCAA